MATDPELRDAIRKRLKRLDRDRFGERLWQRDAALFKSEPEHQEIIRDSLGWLAMPEAMATKVDDITSFATSVAGEGYRHAVLLGMGGSSLAPEVLRRTFGVRDGLPRPASSATPPTPPRCAPSRPPSISTRRCSSSPASRAAPPRRPTSTRTSSSASRRSTRRRRGVTSWPSPIPIRRCTSRRWSSASGPCSSIRPTSAAATRRSRTSDSCRRR